MVDRSKIPIIQYGALSPVNVPTTSESTDFPTSIYYFRGDQVWKILEVSAISDIKLEGLTDEDILIYNASESIWKNVSIDLFDRKVAVDSAAVPDYLGATSSSGVLRTNSSINKTDGGDFVTLSVNASAVDHNTLSNLTIGDVHTQYLRTDGTRDLTGDWAISANDIQLTAGQLRLRDATIYIQSIDAGHLDLVAGTSVDITSPSLLLQTALATIDFGSSTTQIWKSGTNNLTFKDSVAGTFTLSQLAADNKVAVDTLAISDYIGATSATGVLRTDNTITKTDGGNFVTLSVSASSVDHNALLNLTVGDVHTQYLLIDGTRAMSGALDVGGNYINNLAGLYDGTYTLTMGSNPWILDTGFQTSSGFDLLADSGQQGYKSGIDRWDFFNVQTDALYSMQNGYLAIDLITNVAGPTMGTDLYFSNYTIKNINSITADEYTDLFIGVDDVTDIGQYDGQDITIAAADGIQGMINSTGGSIHLIAGKGTGNQAGSSVVVWSAVGEDTDNSINTTESIKAFEIANGIANCYFPLNLQPYLTNDFNTLVQCQTFNGAAYTNRTSEANGCFGTPFVLLADSNDFLYIGLQGHYFANIGFNLATLGQGLTLKTEYWNGSSWIDISAGTSDSTAGFANNNQIITIDIVTASVDWSQNVINGVTAHWIRFSTPAVTIAPTCYRMAFSRTLTPAFMIRNDSYSIGYCSTWTGFNGIYTGSPNGMLEINKPAIAAVENLRLTSATSDVLQKFWKSDSAYATIKYDTNNELSIDNIVPNKNLNLNSNVKITGQLNVQAGTGIAPAIYFGTDSNSGFFSDEDGKLKLVLNGTTQMQWGVGNNIYFAGTNILMSNAGGTDSISSYQSGGYKSFVSFTSDSNITLFAGAAGVDYTLKFDGETSDLIQTWMEDEGRLDYTIPNIANAGLWIKSSGTTGLVGLDIGQTTNIKARLWYDHNQGDLYLDNNYNNAAGEIFLRVKNTTKVLTLKDDAITFGTNADTDITMNFTGTNNSGIMKWMEDEDYFEYFDDILMDTTEKIQFRDTATSISSITDGHLDLDAATSVDINATSGLLIASGLAPISFADTNTQIWEDVSSNLTFKDANAGTWTLTQLTESLFMPVWNLIY